MNNIDREQLNRTIDGALESLWVKLIEDNKFAYGWQIHRAIQASNLHMAEVFLSWAVSGGFDFEKPVGDWE